MARPIPPQAVTLRTALVSDALDALGYRSQCLGWDILPVASDAPLVGRAYTVTCVPVDSPPEVAYQGLLRALDGIGQDEIFVIPTRRSNTAAVWGELLSTACKTRGAAGALTDGLVRDLSLIRKLGFPVYARGSLPYDINGRFEVVDVGEQVDIDGVPIEHEQLLLADEDGVVAVPPEVEQEAIEGAAVKLANESVFRRAIADGMLPSAAYERFRVL